MKTIGFAGTFYTLWDVEIVPNYVTLRTARGESQHHSGNTIRYTYFRNLSKDLLEAIKKAGTDNVDESLRGQTRSFERSESFDYPVEYFSRGYNKGSLISECMSIRDLVWALENEWSEERRVCIERQMGTVGMVKYEGKWYNSQCDADKVIAEKQQVEAERLRSEAILSKYAEQGIYEFICERNPASDGCVYIQSDGVFVEFREIGCNSYKGFDYYLPMVNGKCKRVKGKIIKATVKVIESKCHGGLVLDIISFEILK